jgi:hypothetical protein
MPAVSLNQLRCALPTWSCFSRFFLLSFFFSVFARRLFCRFNLLAFHNVCCPNASLLVLGLSFYPLEQAPNMVIYAISKSATATSGLI